MGSPYNGANIKLTGAFVPELSDYTFQDISLITENGRVCYLVQWEIDKSPGFIVWKIDADNKVVLKSKRIEGCCDSLYFDKNTVKIVSWSWDSDRKIDIKNEVIVIFAKL